MPLLYHWNIIGHEKELARLEQEISENNLNHAYLFAGPDKIGKNAIAKTFAGILQCENHFCHTCPTCIQIQKGCHYDTFEMIDDGETITIDRIRELIGSLALSTQSPRKIILIQNIERLSDSAMNALLKSLEEPPRRVIFLLTTNDLKAISDTIISRVRLYSFRLVPKNILAQELQARYPDVEAHTLDLIFSFFLGKPGKAIELLSDPELLTRY
ncbi:AAA family ATPase, partial [Candidatus Peregrinibacteria bacterium]|nr:AAA family ATPase [Candidatus Peregrinibacteria bacterium]